MPRVLALDVGHVRVGLALSDPMQVIAQPYMVLPYDPQKIFIRIRDIVAEQSVERVVVGQPLQLNGRAGLAVDFVSEFVEQLRTKLSVPIIMWDERLTTSAAERVMIQDGVRRKKRRQRIDQIAAAILLQSYLDTPK